MSRTTRTAWAGIVLFLWILPAYADLTLVLKKEFIEQYKNRTSIDTHCFVDKAHEHPNRPSKDGDLHVATRCDGVNLAVVAEIMNAKDRDDAVDLIHAKEGTGQKLRLKGAWRLWPEHGGSDEKHSQWDPPTEAFTGTNPDHLFEIHPVTIVGDLNVGETLKPIKGYQPKEASDAFFHYESKSFHIKPLTKSVEMTFPGVGYNYVKFIMKLNEKPFRQEDGYTAFAEVRDTDGHLLIRKRRMVFVEGGAPAEIVKDMAENQCLVVLGMPRLNLALISWRVAHAKTRPEVLTWSMPYEMIIVGVYDDECESGD